MPSVSSKRFAISQVEREMTVMTTGPSKGSKPESRAAVAIRVARQLEKTQARNPVVSSQAIGPRTARVKAVLRKYGVDI
jgi:hypothetical protein